MKITDKNIHGVATQFGEPIIYTVKTVTFIKCMSGEFCRLPALSYQFVPVTLAQDVHIDECHCLPNLKALGSNRDGIPHLSRSHISGKKTCL